EYKIYIKFLKTCSMSLTTQEDRSLFYKVVLLKKMKENQIKLEGAFPQAFDFLEYNFRTFWIMLFLVFYIHEDKERDSYKWVIRTYGHVSEVDEFALLNFIIGTCTRRILATTGKEWEAAFFMVHKLFGRFGLTLFTFLTIMPLAMHTGLAGVPRQ
ncbi:hypothetical protein ACJX0J_016070, partial [Zea mays]